MSLSQTHAWMLIINQKIEEIATAMDSKLDIEHADVAIEKFMAVCKPLRKDQVDRKDYQALKIIIDKQYRYWCAA